MKTIRIGSTREVAAKIATALGIPLERTQRIILDVDVTRPIAVIYVQMIGDVLPIEVICDIIGPFALAGDDGG